MSESCLIFFPSSACDLAGAERALVAAGLPVARRDGALVVRRPRSPEYRVRRVAGAMVRAEAAEIGAGTPHAAAMEACDARFEIAFDDLRAALDEINTLMEVQGALQDASQGFLFLPWNGKLSEAWRGS
jgi:hypothetical protein